MSLGPVGLMKKNGRYIFSKKKIYLGHIFQVAWPPPPSPKSLVQLSPIQTQVNPQFTTAHPWCSGHSTSINACGVWGVRVGVQVFRREFHTHIYLD